MVLDVRLDDCGVDDCCSRISTVMRKSSKIPVTGWNTRRSWKLIITPPFSVGGAMKEGKPNDSSLLINFTELGTGSASSSVAEVNEGRIRRSGRSEAERGGYDNSESTL